MLIKLATQHADDEDTLTTLAAFGVNHICGALPSRKLDENFSVDALQRRRERVASLVHRGVTVTE